MEDYLLLEIPAFKPEYKAGVPYGYGNVREKENTKAILYQASNGYCMYCYSRILIDGKKYGQLEHAIEKNNAKKLTECIPNIGFACPICNSVFKRRDEKKRKIQKPDISQFNRKSKCTCKKRTYCTKPCEALYTLRDLYTKGVGAEIILQPLGVKGNQTGEDLELQYHISRSEFQPAVKKHAYSKAELQFIENHILRFRLNDSEFKTRQLQNFIRCVIDMGGKIPEYEYNNLIVKLFVNKLNNKTESEILKICEKIYISSFLCT